MQPVTTTVRVRDARGEPLAGREVEIAQRSHAFGFGNIWFDLPLDKTGAELEQAEHLAGLWLDLHNLATLPFYWGHFEPEPGHPHTDRLREMAQWFTGHDVVVKGHPLVWHTLTAPWLRDLPVAEVEARQRARIQREVTDFAGLVDIWDAINEAVIMPVFTKEDNGITRLCWERGRIATVRMAFEEARAANPRATLILNDFDMSSGYECLIEGVLEAGIQVDVLGLQSHMHQGYWGLEKTQRILERFARFGLPIHFTETTLLSGELMPAAFDDLNDYQPDHWPSTPDGEERQAVELVEFYRTLVAHPAVQAISYWGLSDAGAWLGAPAGLVRADGTPKPAYQALHELIKGEWWLAPTTMTTDDDGRVRLTGLPGEYQVTGGGSTVGFALGPGEADVQLPHS